MSECLLYYIKNGLTRLGKYHSKGPGGVQDIQLNGSLILDEHCLFKNENGLFRFIFSKFVFWLDMLYSCRVFIFVFFYITIHILYFVLYFLYCIG